MGITTGGHDIEDFQEEVVGLLGEHEAEKRAAFGGGVVVQVLAEQLDFATDGFEAGRQRLEQRRLARAVGTRQGHDVTLAEADVDLGNQRLASVANQKV